MQLTMAANDTGTLSSVLGTINDIQGVAQDISDLSSTSLFEYTKKSIISSRVFIEQSIGAEEIMTDVMLNIMNIYTALILTTLDINQYVTSSQTVRSIIGAVATEALKEQPIDMQKSLADYFYGSTANAKKMAPSFAANVLDDFREEINEIRNRNKTNVPHRPMQQSGVQQSDQSILNTDLSKVSLPSGRIIQIHLAVPSVIKKHTLKEDRVTPSHDDQGNLVNWAQTNSVNKDGYAESTTVSRRFETANKDALVEEKFGNGITINLFLNLMPRFMPQEVAHQFVAMNFTPSLAQRWMQMQVGEISFFKDFLLAQDLRKARRAALRKDKSGVLLEMEERRKNAVGNMWLKRSTLTPNKQNIANTILIFDKQSFDMACSKASLNFKNYNSRQRFFDQTFSMMVVTVDPMYNKVAMYYHSLPAVSEFTFDQMKRNSKTEATDMTALMKQFAQGMAPKF